MKRFQKTIPYSIFHIPDSLHPKKSLGQNFLTSTAAVAKIIAAGEIKSDDVILEIGPGKGVLTEKLLASAGKVIAVEKDDALFELLREKFATDIEARKLVLIHDDILNFDQNLRKTPFSSLRAPCAKQSRPLPESRESWIASDYLAKTPICLNHIDLNSYLLTPTSYKLISNIPYNITGTIIRKFLTTEHQPSLIVLLVQKEVAERIVARNPSQNSSRAGGKESLLSISVKVYGKPQYIATVKAGSFFPAPKVDSAIIKVSNISHNFFTHLARHGGPSEIKAINNGFTEGSPLYVDNLQLLGTCLAGAEQLEETTYSAENYFFKFVSAGFAHKRKLLSGNLSEFFKTKEEWAKACEIAKINPKSRAENLSVENWRALLLSTRRCQLPSKCR